MIGRLTGVAIDKGLDGCCVVDVGGVGYEVYVPLRTAGALPAAPAKTTLFVHTHVREEALTLYGFGTLDDRRAFRAMLGVSGVGPRLALAILSEMACAELASTIARGDRKRFSAVAGVGKKTAERLVMELEGKLDPGFGGTADLPGSTAGSPVPEHGRAGELVSALIGLGFSRGEAERAVADTLAKIDTEPEPPVEALLRQALSNLA